MLFCDLTIWRIQNGENGKQQWQKPQLSERKAAKLAALRQHGQKNP